MKKTKKKLVLAKETLRALGDLDHVRGGGPTDQASCGSCPPYYCQAQPKPWTNGC